MAYEKQDELIRQIKAGELSLEQLTLQLEKGELEIYDEEENAKHNEHQTVKTLSYLTPEAAAVLEILHYDIIDLFNQILPAEKQVNSEHLVIYLTALSNFDAETGKRIVQKVKKEEDSSLPRYYITLRDALRDEVERRKKPKRGKSRKIKPTPLDSVPFLHFNADKASKFFVESLMPGAVKPMDQLEKTIEKFAARGYPIHSGFVAACINDTDSKFASFVGYTSDVVFNFLQEKSALAVKAHIALGARAAVETGAEIGKPILLSVSQFCDDLGFKEHKGAHRRENKQHALRILETLTRAELMVLWIDPNKPGKIIRTKGDIWKRGRSTEELDVYNDLWGANRVPGTEDLWDPQTFSYMPGGFFEDTEWRKYNNYVGLIGKGLLKLGTDNKDKAALFIGAYLAFLGRIENYDRKPIKLSTLIEKTGDLLTPYITRRKPEMIETILENAFDRLKSDEINFLSSWEWVYDQKLKPSETDSTIKTSELMNRRVKFVFPQLQVERGKAYSEQKLLAQKR